MNQSGVGERGVSGVILTIIMIVLVLAAVAVIWGIINNILSQESEKITLDKFTINVGIQSAKVEGENILVNVLRNKGKGNLTGLKFIFFDGKNSEEIERKVSLKELEQMVFNFTLNKLNVSEVETVSIAPILLSSSGKEVLGDIVDLGSVKLGTSINGDSGDNEGGETCIPNVNACSGIVCGTADDGCGILISCGTCDEGFICSEDKTQCIEGTCTPDGTACDSLVCGDVVNSCGDLISCGTCGLGESCSAGLCIPGECTPKNVTESCGEAICGTADDGCGSLVSCGTCDLGFSCSAGLCIPEVSINSGIIDLTWPPGINLFFDSYNLSTTESYVGKFAKFPGSAETRCLPVTDHVFPSDPEIYNKSFVRLGTPDNEKTLILTGDNYEIWESLFCGGG